MLNDEVITTIQQITPGLMETAVIPGVSLAIIHANDIWQSQWGVMNTVTNQPVTSQTVFQAASLSKPVFASAVLQLVLNGQLNLDTPLITYLPAAEQEARPQRCPCCSHRLVLAWG